MNKAMTSAPAPSCSANESAWIHYNNKLNPRDQRMSEAWVVQLRQWLNENAVGPGNVMLDFGCGYFDLGITFAGVAAQVDGFDINPDAVAIARHRTQGMRGVTLYSRRDDIPPANYDLIVVNSVLQYLGSLAVVDEFMHFASSRLKPGPSMIILADIIPPSYSPGLDALDSLLFAAQNGLLSPMIRHLLHAAFRPRGMELLRIEPEALSRMAHTHRLTCERLPANLTPARRRYTCILRRQPPLFSGESK